MRKHKIGKHKIGDIVRLLPWCNFDKHIGIPGPYWTELMNKDLKIKSLDDDNSYNLILNRESASNIFYQFKNRSFSWAEEFIKLANPDFLSDKDFEI